MIRPTSGVLSTCLPLETFQILGRERLRVRDFLNKRQCARVNHGHFGGKTWQPLSFYYEFWRERRSSGNKLSKVRSFSILLSGEGSTSFNNDHIVNVSGEKKYNEEFRGVCFMTIFEKTLNQISYSQSFSSSNLKVSINISLRAHTSPFRRVARSHARVARERRRECERLCRSLASCRNLRSGSIFVRFENYIPAGMAKRKEVAVRENVREPLKLGLISGQLSRGWLRSPYKN